MMRVTVIILFAGGLIAWGLHLVPPDFEHWFELGELQKWTIWSFFGLFMIVSGIFNLLKVSIFLCRSIGTWGEWRYKLADGYLTWDVPEHAHGPETGFRAKLSDIKEIEYRTEKEYDEMDKREYWIHFWDRESIELKSYTSLSLAWLVSKINQAGVQYNETIISK